MSVEGIESQLESVWLVFDSSGLVAVCLSEEAAEVFREATYIHAPEEIWLSVRIEEKEITKP